MSDLHLLNAARTLEQLLGAREPDHIVIATVRPERSSTEANLRRSGESRNIGTEPEHTNALTDGRITATSSFHHHRREKAA